MSRRWMAVAVVVCSRAVSRAWKIRGMVYMAGRQSAARQGLRRGGCRLPVPAVVVVLVLVVLVVVVVVATVLSSCCSPSLARLSRAARRSVTVCGTRFVPSSAMVLIS